VRLLAVVLFLFVQTPGEAPQPRASLEGMVLQSGSGEPLSRAELKLERVRTPEEEKEASPYQTDPRNLTAYTNSDGAFLFKDVEPGPYRLTAVRNGYARQLYGRKVADGPGTILNLAAGQTTRNVTVRMVVGAVITGRVRTSAGEPMVGMSVTLRRLSYDGQPGTEGRKRLSNGESTSTDDRGEYRFYWIEAGRYYLQAGEQYYLYYGQGAGEGVRDPSLAAIAYYPGTVDPDRATVIEVAAGSETAGLDITVPPAYGHRIRGRVVDAATGKPPRSVDVDISPRKFPDISNPSLVAPPEVFSGGTFEIRNVPPGSYWLSASSNPDPSDPIAAERLAEIRTGRDVWDARGGALGSIRIPFEMPASDVSGIVLTLIKPLTIPVRISFEGQASPPEQDLGDFRVRLSAPDLRVSSSSRPNAAGVARLEGVLPGEYRSAVTGNEKFYVKEILYGREDALNKTVQITDQAPASLNVLLSGKGGRIEGTVTDAASQPVSGIDVVLIPDDREKKFLYQKVTADHSGRYDFKMVAPGAYKLFSWEALEQRAYYDAEVLSRYDAQGLPIRVQESSKQTLGLRIIPPPTR
jgi:hypothetical protein